MTDQPDRLGPLVELVRDRLARDPGGLTPHRVATALRAAGSPVGDATVLAVHDQLRRDVVGAGPLEPLLRTPGVTDVLVNGPDQVHLDRGRGLEPAAVRFPDDDAVRRLAQRLAASAGRRLDDATPHVDVRLADGTRCHAVLGPVARPGTSISLRVPSQRVLSLDDLRAAGSVTDEWADLLREVVDARLAFLVTGGTGVGKTTLLASLLSLVDPRERLVLVEDASELRPDHPHVVGLEARPPNLEGVGEVTVRTLVRQALRMRPDRLVVGEVRSPPGVSAGPDAALESRRDTRRSSSDTWKSESDTRRVVPTAELPAGESELKAVVKVNNSGLAADGEREVAGQEGCSSLAASSWSTSATWVMVADTRHIWSMTWPSASSAST